MLVLASDFDGTLKQNGTVSEEDIQTIQKFQKAGNKFGIITGRSIGMIRGELEEFHVPFDFLICNNGAIIANQDYHIMQRMDPDFDDAKDLVEELIQDEELLVGVSDGDRFGLIQPGRIQLKKGHVSNRVKRVPTDWHLLYQQGVLNSVYMRHQDVDKAWHLCQYLTQRYEGKLNFHFNHGAIDVTVAGINKKTGIELLKKMMNNPVAVIGDGHNDLPMIEAFSGYSVTAAPDSVKEKASKVFDTVSDCLIDMMQNEKGEVSC